MIPKIDSELTVEKIRKALASGADRLCDHKKDAEDRRCRRGAYEPPTSLCLVCQGVVAAVVRFRDTGRLGGPPPSSFIHHWECRDCGLQYGKLPGPTEG